ncbi:hypothetical protein GCM10009624_07220 [Gordonia sinesedis]
MPDGNTGLVDEPGADDDGACDDGACDDGTGVEVSAVVPGGADGDAGDVVSGGAWGVVVPVAVVSVVVVSSACAVAPASVTPSAQTMTTTNSRPNADSRILMVFLTSPNPG